jgi:predicted pyridoxine 5'-phosphate oxidase superfamily flavin-nucleotide-binding protein
MSTIEAPPEKSPWHEGERAVQRAAGVDAGKSEAIGRRNIRDFMPDQHRAFFAQLPFLIAGSVDGAGRPWASLVSGPPGFAHSPDPKTLRIAARPAAGDPLAAALTPGAPIGLLGIELSTRRRNRLNGRIGAVEEGAFTVAVEQSFGNCPQYIQSRVGTGLAEGAAPVTAEPFAALDEGARSLIRTADTCFVASAAPAAVGAGGRAGRDWAVDVSHRGGRAGFIGIVGAGDGEAIVIPDYRGNRFFNTLGNLAVNPRAGLLFIDFARGDLLQLTGTTEIVWDGGAVRAFAGAERLWRLTPQGGRWLRGGFPLRLAFRDFSPQSLATGTFAEAEEAGRYWGR